MPGAGWVAVERVTLLLEQSGERLSALLNPENLHLQRTAGLRVRGSMGGAVTGTALADSPLLFTGGGMTELRVDLLFDVTLGGSSVQTNDVRDLTQPFFSLAENVADPGGDGRPPLVRFISGKGWNFPGVVAAVAERLEYFTDLGSARRSWLRMRMLRVSEDAPVMPPEPAIIGDLSDDASPDDLGVPDQLLDMHPVIGAGTDADSDPTLPPQTERLDQIAQQHYGHPALWRVLALYNGIADPLHLEPGLVLRVPPLGALGGGS